MPVQSSEQLTIEFDSLCLPDSTAICKQLFPVDRVDSRIGTSRVREMMTMAVQLSSSALVLVGCVLSS